MGLLDKVYNLFRKKNYGGNVWHPVGSYAPGADFWGRTKPTQTQLVSAFTDTVYACTSLIADTFLNTKIPLYVRTDAGMPKPKCKTIPAKKKNLPALTRVDEVVAHPLLDLLKYCNGYHNWVDLLSLTILYEEITGNAFWLMKFDGIPTYNHSRGLPNKLYLLPSHLVTPEKDERGHVVCWKFGQGSEQESYKPEEIIHFKMPNLADPYGVGYSPLQAAWDRVQIGFKELGYLDSVMMNSGRPDAILAPDEPIAPGEQERLAKEFIQRFRGQGSGGVFVADGPMKLTPLSWPAKDLAELQLYNVIKNAVSNVYHIPPEIWELGNANRATAEAILYALAVHCIKPRLIRFVEKLNERLIPFFDDRLFFEADNPVPEDRQFELQERQMLLTQCVITRDEVRQEYGYESKEWAKDPLMPPGVLPAIAPTVEQPEQTQELPLVGDQPATDTDSANALRATVGGSQQIMALQSAYYQGQIPRPAAIANARIIFGLSQQEAEALFPEEAPTKLTQDQQQQPEPPPVKAKALELPDIRQEGDYDCGSAATMSVARYFQVGPEGEAEYIEALGTTEDDGTTPEAIAEYLTRLGLQVEARNDLTIQDLAEYTRSGKPVICCIQDYEENPAEIADEASGHYVVVTQVEKGNDYVLTLQDPSAGIVKMEAKEFLARWEDRDQGGHFVHYGIAVSSPRKSIRKTHKQKSPIPLINALQKYFQKQAGEVLAKLKTADNIETKALHNWIDMEDWTEEMAKVFRPIVATYYDFAAKQCVSRIGASWNLLKVIQPHIQEGVEKATMAFCQETNATTTKELDQAITQLKKEITDGLVEGDYQNALMGRVQKVFENAAISRAYRIGITEASRGQSAGQYIAAKESGIVKGKKWIASANACPECRALAGKVVGLDDNFAENGTGVYTDTPFPPHHPNCTCSWSEVVD